MSYLLPLISPGRVQEYLVLPSLELCIQSAILKEQGHTVSLLDMKINRLSAQTAADIIERATEQYDLIYIDDSPETHCVSKQLITMLSDNQHNSFAIAMRGEIESFCPEMIMQRNPGLDFIVRFDDDYALLFLLEKLKSGSTDYETIKNFVFRKGKQIVVTESESRPYMLDSLPMPDRRLYDIPKYLERDSETIVRSTRGCPSNCLFCIKTRYEQFGTFSMSRFLDEIEELQQMGFESFFFSDDTFGYSDERVREFASEVARRGIKIRFTSNMRIKDITEYKIKTLKQVGAYRVFVGIETINTKSSSLINKNLLEKEIREKLAILHKYGMEFHASFILGAPNDSEEDLENLISFVREVKPTIVTFNLIKAYPGLPIYQNPEKYGIVMDDPYWFESDSWTTRCVIGTKQLPPNTLEQWSKRLLFEFIKDKE